MKLCISHPFNLILIFSIFDIVPNIDDKTGDKFELLFENNLVKILSLLKLKKDKLKSIEDNFIVFIDNLIIFSFLFFICIFVIHSGIKYDSFIIIDSLSLLLLFFVISSFE